MMISNDCTLAGLYSLEGCVQKGETSMKARLFTMITTSHANGATINNKKIGGICGIARSLTIKADRHFS